VSPIVSERRVLEVLGRSAGGTARHVAQIVAGLHGRDGLSLDLAGPADWTVEMPRPVYAVAVPDGVTGHGSAIRAVRDLALLGRYDAVHAHGLRAGIDCGLALRGRLPLFVSVHNVLRPDVSGRPRYALLGWTEGLLMVLATHVFTASAEIARALSRRAPRHSRKLEVLHLGVDETPPVRRSAAEVRAELEVAPGDALVVTAARLAPQKALHVMLAALSRLEDCVVLAVLGEGPLEEDLRAHAGRLGVGGRVRWLGWRDDVADFLAAANAFCLSSNWEACALAAQ
jgi:glycosyltransferase involved in cell wall biosynthesis